MDRICKFEEKKLVQITGNSRRPVSIEAPDQEELNAKEHKPCNFKAERKTYYLESTNAVKLRKVAVTYMFIQ